MWNGYSKYIGPTGVSRSRIVHGRIPDRPLTFVLTGTMSSPRRDIQRSIVLEGHGYTMNVTMRTDFLVVGESPGRTKLQAATRHGTSCIDESWMWQILSGNNP